VRTAVGEEVSVPVAPHATVKDVKEALQDAKGISPIRQELYLGRKALDDDVEAARTAKGKPLELRIPMNGGCDCCVSLCKALLIIIFFPFILFVMVFGIIVYIILFPCYCLSKCCCEECCCVIFVEEHVVKKCVCFPCIACAWVCEDVADA